MLLVEFTINAVVNYLSVEYINSLTHQWRGRISNFDPPQRKLPYDYGGYCEMGYGSISFFPDLFDSDWPPPITGAITIKYTATTEGAAETLFVGTAHLEEINRSSITYGLYGSNFDETIADATAYNNTLNVILATILEGIAEITTLNTDDARAISPNVLHTTSGLKLSIDLASSIAAFYTHLFYVDGTTAYLIDMLGDSGTSALDEFDFGPAKYPYNSPISLARSGDFSQTSAYAYGKELSVAQYHNTEANVNVCLNNIITIMNRPRVEISTPFLGSVPTPGAKRTWTDESQGTDLGVTMYVRNITYEFNPDRDEIILKGDGVLA